MSEQPSGLSEITPEQFAEMVSGASDEDIGTAIRAVGADQALARIFQGFQERFRPEKAQGVDADIQFVVTDDGTEHRYAVRVHDGACSTEQARVDNPKTTLETDLVSFVKLVTGQADGMRLFMERKLKVSGDLMFATRIMTFFDRPSA